MFRPIPGMDGVTKAFMNAPSESWNPRTGQYTLSMTWVYEADLPFTQSQFGGVRPAGFQGVMKAAQAPFPTTAVDVVQNSVVTDEAGDDTDETAGNRSGGNLDSNANKAQLD